MQTTLKRLAKLTAGYSLVTLVGPLFTILLTPLYTRVLTPADYGVVEVALTFSALLSVFALGGMDQALSAYFFDGDETFRRNLVTTTLACVCVAGLLLGLLMFAFAHTLAEIFFKTETRYLIFQLLAINMVSSPVYSVIAAALRLRMGVRRVNVLGLAQLFTNVACNIVFVLFLHLRATGIVAANVIAYSVAACVGLALVWQPLRGQVLPTLGRVMWRAGVGLLPGAIGFLLLMNIDRLLLTQFKFVSQTDIGLYAIANKLASMLSVLTAALWSAWWPMALEMADKPDAQRQYARMFEYFAAGQMLLALGMGLLAPQILSLFTTTNYVPAAPYAMVLMAFMGPIGIMSAFFQIGLYTQKKTHLVSVTFFIAAAVNIALNLVLCPVIGVWGAVWATLIAGIALAVSSYILGQRILFVNYRWLRVSTLVLVYSVIIGFVLVVPSLSTLSVRLAAIALFVLAVFGVGIASTHQLYAGYAMVRARLGR